MIAAHIFEIILTGALLERSLVLYSTLSKYVISFFVEEVLNSFQVSDIFLSFTFAKKKENRRRNPALEISKMRLFFIVLLL